MAARIGIIGAGPAGVSAAVQLKRYGFEPVIFEKGEVGGLVRNAYRVDNSMLFPRGIKGMEIANVLREYLNIYGITPVHAEVVEVRYNAGTFRLTTPKGDYEFDYLIVATGTRPKTLPYPCVRYHVADIAGYFGRVLIIGGGDIALDYSLTLSERAREVIILHRSDLKAIRTLQEEVLSRENIRLVRGEARDVYCESGRVKVVSTSGVFEVDALFAAIGRVPNVDIVEGIESERMFIIGDAKNGIYRQSSLAIADGIKAAMAIWRWEMYGNP